MQTLMTPWHRRHAFLLASQLPDNPQDARMITEALQELVEKFLIPEDAPAQKSADILSIVSG